MRKGYIYIIEKGNERYEYEKIVEVAKVLECVPSTAFIYAKANKVYKGWKITRIENKNPTEPKRQKVKYNPRKRHKGQSNWNYNKFSFMGNEIICCEKTYFIDGQKEYVLEDFLKIKALLIKGVHMLFKDYVHDVYVRIPEITLTKRVNKIVDKRMVNVQVYVGWKGEDHKLIDQVNEIEDKILLIDKIIEYETWFRHRNNTD